MEWLIVYGDGSTFTNGDGAPEDAPRQNVQMVYNRDPHVGRRDEQSRYGYWGWRDDYGWVAFQTESGFWDYMFESGIRQIPLFGRTLPTEAWWEIQRKAFLLTEKSGWLPVEKDGHHGP